MNYGVDVKFSDATEATVAGTFSNNVDLHFNATHKVDKNWSVGMHQHFYGSRVEEKKNPVDVGFTLNYKL